MAYLDGKTQARIAEELGIPIGTVKTRTLAAMRKLRKPCERSEVLSEDHERIDELLAGYVLLSSLGEDAAEADRILAEHVPSCGRCRATLNELQAVSGDLALAAAPVDPPETLPPRIHRAIDEVPLAGRTPRRGAPRSPPRRSRWSPWEDSRSCSGTGSRMPRRARGPRSRSCPRCARPARNR